MCIRDRFSRPLFFDFCWFLMPWGVPKVWDTPPPFWLLFGSWGLIFLIGEHFGQFWWILVVWEPFLHDCFVNFWVLCLANAIAFCGQDSGRSRQDFGKILTGAAKILSNFLHICERQECSGVRRSSRKANNNYQADMLIKSKLWMRFASTNSSVLQIRFRKRTHKRQ